MRMASCLVAKAVCGLGFLFMFVCLATTARGAYALVPLVALIALGFPTTYGSAPWYVPAGLVREMTFQAANALRVYDRLGIPEVPSFWVGASQPEVISVPRSFFFCTNFAGSFPSTSIGKRGFEPYFQPLTEATIGPAKTLVVVAVGSGLGGTAAATLSRLGYQSHIVGEWQIGADALTTSMTVLSLSRP